MGGGEGGSIGLGNIPKKKNTASLTQSVFMSFLVPQIFLQVYPAGHAWIHYALYQLTDSGWEKNFIIFVNIAFVIFNSSWQRLPSSQIWHCIGPTSCYGGLSLQPLSCFSYSSQDRNGNTSYIQQITQGVLPQKRIKWKVHLGLGYRGDVMSTNLALNELCSG